MEMIKALQDALQDLTVFIAPIDGTRSTVEEYLGDLKSFKVVSEDLEGFLADLIKDLKKTKAPISKEQQATLNAKIAKWSRTNLYLSATRASGHADLIAKNLVSAQKSMKKL